MLSAFTLEPSTFSAATPIPSFLWISADNAISIGQSFRTIANGLGLLESDEEKRDVAVATYKVKKWLATTNSTFLLVFDNVDDFAALKTAWPTAIHGSILLTTRDFIVATSLATKYVLVDALSDEDGSRLLLKAVDHDDSLLDAQQQQQQQQ
ncbi:NB-ARC and TPR domain protein [Metarhizium guizhouense ARSEF 977]|uniref:NB-ARC and TPR domain protein n=1 Tax=Metarhizium guizhouense (strain ARSEF 977) TaxID=1276136 RepID=A0A0B4HI13_METGA|nr:NB-ARC and TPR domain protein [Metarhizium guizhouense ARSEF 977]